MPPAVPWHRGCGRGRTDRQTPVCPNSHNGRTSLGQPSARSSSVVTSSAESPRKGNPTAQTNPQGNTQGARGSSSLQCYRCQGWGHMVRECATPVALLNREGGTWGNAVKPSPIARNDHNLPRKMQINKRGGKTLDPIPFLNPDPVA